MIYWTEEDFKEIYARYQESGLTIRQFCKNEDILEGRFHHWKKKFEKRENPSPFIPMKLNSQTGNLEIKRNIISQGRQQPAPTGSSLCEIVYPNGVVLRINAGMSPENLRSLLFLK